MESLHHPRLRESAILQAICPIHCSNFDQCGYSYWRFFFLTKASDNFSGIKNGNRSDWFLSNNFPRYPRFSEVTIVHMGTIDRPE